jgi:hypothetical protein
LHNDLLLGEDSPAEAGGSTRLVNEHSHLKVKRERDDRYVRLNKAATLRTIADLAAVDLAPRNEPNVPK